MARTLSTNKKDWKEEDYEHDFYLKTAESPEESVNPFFVVLGEGTSYETI